MPNKILFGNEARKKLIEGVDLVAKAVGTTLGPRGRAVAIDRGFDIWVHSDGVNVAKNIDVKDPLVNVGVRLMKEAAEKQLEVGDGTTVVMILAEALVKEAHRQIENGANPMSLRNSFEKGQELLLKELDKFSKPVKTKEQKIQIATISSKEEKLGKLIAGMVDKTGDEGVITVEESKTSETFVEHQEGMQLDKGYVSPYFITNPLRMESTIENPNILITDKPLTNIKEILSFIEKAAQLSLNLVIIAPEIKDTVLSSMILTKMNGAMNLLAVQAPGFEQKQKDILQDIATLTEGQVITIDAGQKFEEIDTSVLGKAKRITATKDATLIIASGDAKEAIKERIESLKKQVEDEANEFDQKKLKERIAKLSAGVAIIKVGGQTEAEMKERRERALDAVAATQSAVIGGLITGGEIVYLHVRKILEEKLVDSSSYESIAFNILNKALEQPFKKLVSNAGLDEGVYLNKVLGLDINKGIDVTDGEVKDLIKEGIVDPTLVAKSAIQNAISIAIQIISIDVLIVPEPEEEKGGNKNGRR